jgi:hypothetical protein
MVHQELERSRSVPYATMSGEDVVADIDLAGLQPFSIDVVIDPSDYLVVDDDASRWFR